MDQLSRERLKRRALPQEFPARDGRASFERCTVAELRLGERFGRVVCVCAFPPVRETGSCSEDVLERAKMRLCRLIPPNGDVQLVLVIREDERGETLEPLR